MALKRWTGWLLDILRVRFHCSEQAGFKVRAPESPLGLHVLTGPRGHRPGTQTWGHQSAWGKERPSDFTARSQSSKNSPENIISLATYLEDNPFLSMEKHMFCSWNPCCFYSIRSIFYFIIICKFAFDIFFISKWCYLGRGGVKWEDFIAFEECLPFPRSPEPLATVILLYPSMILTILDSSYSGVMQYFSFYDWLISFSIMPF